MPSQPRKSWYRQHPKTAIGLGAVAGLVSLSGILATSAHAATSTPQATPSCQARANAWAEGKATRQFDALQSDLKTFSTAAQNFSDDLGNGAVTSSDVSAVQSAAASLRTGARAVGDNPGPACVPGLRPDLLAAAGDFAKAGLDASNAMRKYSAGSKAAAAADIKAAAAKLSKGDAKINDASKAIAKFNAS